MHPATFACNRPCLPVPDFACLYPALSACTRICLPVPCPVCQYHVLYACTRLPVSDCLYRTACIGLPVSDCLYRTACTVYDCLYPGMSACTGFVCQYHALCLYPTAYIGLPVPGHVCLYLLCVPVPCHVCLYPTVCTRNGKCSRKRPQE